MKDPVDQGEQPEPTPLNAPEQLPEPDTEAEKKKAEGGDEEWCRNKLYFLNSNVLVIH